MRKLANWDVELVKFCDGMRSQGLRYGESDCVLYAAGGVEVQTGQDLAAAHRGKYSDEDGARAYMREHGWADVDDVADSFLSRVVPAMRRRGDILLHIGDRGKTLGICLGRFSQVLTQDGAIQIASRLAVTAWRVG